MFFPFESESDLLEWQAGELKKLQMNDKTLTSFVLYKSKFQMPEQISLRDIIKCFNDEEEK